MPDHHSYHLPQKSPSYQLLVQFSLLFPAFPPTTSPESPWPPQALTWVRSSDLCF